MKIKKDFVLRRLVDTWVVLPLAEETANFSGMLTLNDAGALLWQRLEQGADKAALVDALTEEYDVTPQQALTDVAEFMEKLARTGCIEPL